ncbi:MAG: hypothetical protein Q9200_001681 [Gallowayella weberi]
MPSQPPIPPLLSTHLHSTPPRGFLSLVTSVLGASANWIILRHIFAALKHPSSDQEQATGVVLVSWLRGSDFWRDGAKKLSGIGEVERLLLKAIDEAKATSTRILLVLDGIDFLLAASEAGVDAVLDTIWELREHVHAMIVSASADFPLIQAQHTPLELNHAAFVTSVAHQARVLWSVRELDTGSARDVSGVLRITRGPAMELGADEEFSNEGVEEEEKELLYFIAGDSSVRVFERGSSGL